MLAPVDFAHPVNQNINNKAGNSGQLKDILAPGAYLSHGFRDWPIVAGIGYNYGPALTESDRTSRGRCFAFVGLDMPLFNLN